MTIREAQAELRPLGIVLTKDVASGEYRVNYRGGEEATAYYTDDKVDALHTGREMARLPRCADCGAQGERMGHQTCPYPADH